MRQRSVCRGSLIVLETVSVPLSLVPAPVSRLDARREGREWFVFNRRGLCQAIRLSGFAVEATTPILRDRPGPGHRGRDLAIGSRLLHGVGARERSIAVRARALAPAAG